MAWRVECNQCKASVLTQDGNSDLLACPCCPEAHSHTAAANDCPGAGRNHVGKPCPHGDESAEKCFTTDAGVPCPGEHCHPGLDGCTVCRPCTLYFEGIVAMSPAGPVVS